MQAPVAPLIAIVGSDGSGKSTVGDALLAWLAERRPTVLCHLGKQSGNLGRAIGRWPLVGRRAERSLERQAREVGVGRGPSTLASLVIYGFSLRRLRRFRRMLALREKGLAIVADRYPQVDRPAAIDGPGFGRTRAEGWAARRLAAVERRQFEWMAGHRPDLVIRLNVDLATALARKPDHRPDSIAAKVAEIPQLTFAGARIVDIDATRPLDEVVAAAKAAVAALLPDGGVGG